MFKERLVLYLCLRHKCSHWGRSHIRCHSRPSGKCYRLILVPTGWCLLLDAWQLLGWGTKKLAQFKSKYLNMRFGEPQIEERMRLILRAPGSSMRTGNSRDHKDKGFEVPCKVEWRVHIAKSFRNMFPNSLAVVNLSRWPPKPLRLTNC